MAGKALSRGASASLERAAARAEETPSVGPPDPPKEAKAEDGLTVFSIRHRRLLAGSGHGSRYRIGRCAPRRTPEAALPRGGCARGVPRVPPGPECSDLGEDSLGERASVSSFLVRGRNRRYADIEMIAVRHLDDNDNRVPRGE